MVVLATKVGRASMCQVASHAKVKPQYFFTGFYTGKKYSCIGLCATVWLYVGPTGIEYLFQSFNGNCFDLIYYLTTSIVSFTRITFSIFVGRTGAHSLQYLQ